MPNEIVKTKEENNVREVTSQQQLSVLLQKVIGSGEQDSLTEEQKTELLAQRRQISEYIHEDKRRASSDERFRLVSLMLFVFLFSGLVLLFKPDSFEQVLALVIGLFGGGAGGYALGRAAN
jgi:hypothetical protein